LRRAISVDGPSLTAEDAGMDAIDQAIVRLLERHGRPWGCR
jgi:hypothetical protein